MLSAPQRPQAEIIKEAFDEMEAKVEEHGPCQGYEPVVAVWAARPVRCCIWACRDAALCVNMTARRMTCKDPLDNFHETI